jgi:hypothetical protein
LTNAVAWIVIYALALALRLDLNWFEFIALALAAAVSVAFPRLGSKSFSRFERALARIGERRVLSIWIAALLAPTLRLALLPVLPPPQPLVTDEYSHLLLADTLAHGRLTNPPHPLWPHFETIHVIQHPTYNSMYLPGQALFLALGQAATGVPWAGVVLSFALMSGALCWMLQAWVPPKWALLGSVLWSLRVGLFGYWMNSYWGGAVGALGGALVLGAWPRLRRQPRLRNAALLGVGMLVLLNTRPFEGFALCLPVVASLAWTLRATALRAVNGSSLRRVLVPVVLPLLGIAAAAVAMLCYYNWRVTGDPLRLPYTVNQQAYGWPMTLIWQTPPEISHRHEDMRRYYDWELGEHIDLLSPAAAAPPSHVMTLWSFFLGPALTLPLLLCLGVFRKRRLRPLLIAAACVLAAVLLEQSRYPHYFSTAAGVILVLFVEGLRRLYAGGRRNPRLLLLARSVPLVVCLAIAARGIAGDAVVSRTNPDYFTSWCCGGPGDLNRAGIIRQLQRIPGKHLVIVRYKLSHSFMEAWIENAADIGQAPIVWARDLGPVRNQRLIAWFKDRRVWLLAADERPLRLSRYTPAAENSPFPPYRPELK